MKMSDASPPAVLLCCVLGAAILYVIAPLSYRGVSVSAFLFIAAALTAFAAGSSVGGAVSAPDQSRNPGPGMGKRLKLVFRACAAIAIAGICVRLYDGFVLRGFDLSGGAAAFRVSAQELTYSASSTFGRATLLSAIGAICYGFSYPVVICAVYWWAQLGRLEKWAALIVTAFPVLESFAGGGVWGAAFLYLFAMFAWIHRSGDRVSARGKRKQRPVLMIFAGLIVIIAGATLFKQRVDLIWGSSRAYLDATASSSFVSPSPWLYDIADVPVVGSVVFSWFWICDYLLQGTAELSYLLSAFDGPPLFGQKQFFVVNKFLSILGVSTFDSYELSLLNPRSGRYQTFLADAYMDFGTFGALVELFLLGLLAGWMYGSRRSGRLAGLFIYPFVQAVLVSGLLINAFAGARLYFLVALICAMALEFVLRGPRRPGLKVGG